MGASSLLVTSLLTCPAHQEGGGAGRRREEERGGRVLTGSLKRGRKWGLQSALPPPLAASPRDDSRGPQAPAQPWPPGAKLTRSGKAWVGAGVGSAAGSRAGGRRTSRGRCCQARGSVPGRAQWLPPPAAGPAGRGRGGRGRGRWASSPPAAPSPCQHPVPPASGCPPS